MAAIGVAIAGAGATTWAFGDRRSNEKVAGAGMVTTALGAALITTAGIWLTQNLSCEVDPDCPTGESCREIPARPGNKSYRQCMPR